MIINNNTPKCEITLNKNCNQSLSQQHHHPHTHTTITVCSVYILPNEEPKESELNNLIEHLSRTFLIIEGFNSHNEIWGRAKTDKMGKVIESLLNQHQLCVSNNKSNTYLQLAARTYSAMDLTICDTNLFIDYNWKVHGDTRGSYDISILSENRTDRLSKKKTRNCNLKKAN